MIERKFLKEAMKRLKTKEFVEKKLEKAGIINVDIQRTTLSTRIGITAERPGIVIGRKGGGIKDLAEQIEKEIGIENPQIEVTDVAQPNLQPKVITNFIKRALERGNKPKRVAKIALSKIMKAGAMGAEIIIVGTSGKGGRSRKEREFAGYMKKAGDPVKQIRVAKEQAKLKQGALGITVRIVPPDVVFPDKIVIKKESGLKEIIEETTPSPEETKAAEEAKTSKGMEELSEEVKPTKAEEKTTKEALKEVVENIVSDSLEKEEPKKKAVKKKTTAKKKTTTKKTSKKKETEKSGLEEIAKEAKKDKKSTKLEKDSAKEIKKEEAEEKVETAKEKDKE